MCGYATDYRRSQDEDHADLTRSCRDRRRRSIRHRAGPGDQRRTSRRHEDAEDGPADPGCHWFQIHGKFTKTATVKAGRVRLVDLDDGTLKVASRHGMRHIPVGKSIVVGHGNYVIMMVGQASDDNYLKLTVR